MSCSSWSSCSSWVKEDGNFQYCRAPFKPWINLYLFLEPNYTFLVYIFAFFVSKKILRLLDVYLEAQNMWPMFFFCFFSIHEMTRTHFILCLGVLNIKGLLGIKGPIFVWSFKGPEKMTDLECFLIYRGLL